MANTTWSTTDRLNVTLSGTNNLVVTATVGLGGVRSIDRVISSKYYWEITVTTASINTLTGIAWGGAPLTAAITVAGLAAVNCSSGNISINNVPQTGIGAITSGAVICIALDFGAQLIWFRNGAAGNWNNSASASPATGAGGYSVVPIANAGIPLYAVMECNNSGGVLTANFGDSAFTGTVPSGFTSGFTAGATPAVNEVLTQLALEEWGTGTPNLQLTQIALEEWATVQTVTPQLVLTQIALEEWASVAVIPVSVGAPMITMIGAP